MKNKLLKTMFVAIAILACQVGIAQGTGTGIKKVTEVWSLHVVFDLNGNSTTEWRLDDIHCNNPGTGCWTGEIEA